MPKEATKELSKLNFSKYIFWVAGMLFVTLYLVASFNNRLVSGDELFFLDAFYEKGMLQSVLEFKYNCRYSSFLLFNLIFANKPDLEFAHINLFIYHFTTLVLLISGMALVIRESARLGFNLRLDWKQLLLFSILFCIPIFFFVPRLIEAWFWTLATTTYTAPLIALLWGVYAIISRKNKLLNLLILAFAFTFIGGALENLALTTLFLLFCVFIASYVYRENSFLKSIRGKVVISAVFTLILLTINILSGGVDERIGLAANTGHSFNDLHTFLTLFLDTKNVLVLPTLLIIFTLGRHLSKNGVVFRKIHIAKVLLLNFGFLAMVCLLTIGPLLFVFGDFGPLRAWIPIYFFMITSMILWSLYLGNRFTLSTKVLAPIAGLALIAPLLFFTKKQVVSTSAYGKAYDQTMLVLRTEQSKGRVEPLRLEVLPDPGILTWFGVTPDTTHQANELVSKTMNLDFDVYMDPYK
jgi:hypothetical protein